MLARSHSSTVDAARKLDGAFGPGTDGETIAAFVDRICARPGRRDALPDLLREDHPLFRGRSTNEVNRIRGYTLAAFEQVGLPASALPYVVEELESGRDAYLVAAAAKGLRGLADPTPEIVPYLFRAIENIGIRDDMVTFETYRPRPALAQPTTALIEIFRTFGWLSAAALPALPRLRALQDSPWAVSSLVRAELGHAITRIETPSPEPRGDCCRAFSMLRRPLEGRLNRAALARPSGIVLEDQDGRSATFDDWVCGKPAVIVFFYTRCENPNKCSLTISRLAQVQTAIRARGLASRIRTLAITYDPAYDGPPLLKTYGDNRCYSFTDDDRIVRATSGFAELERFFRPGVGFGPATVNRHRIELFVLDAGGRITATFGRLQWNVETVVEYAARLRQSRASWLPAASASGRGASVRRLVAAASSVLPSAALTALPKCPLCWAAWLSAAGLAGVDGLVRHQWLRPMLIAALLLNVAVILARCSASCSRRMAVRTLCCAGIAIVLFALRMDAASWMALGTVLIALGSGLAATSDASRRSSMPRR